MEAAGPNSRSVRFSAVSRRVGLCFSGRLGRVAVVCQIKKRSPYRSGSHQEREANEVRVVGAAAGQRWSYEAGIGLGFERFEILIGIESGVFFARVVEFVDFFAVLGLDQFEFVFAEADVPETANDLEDFAACGEHAAGRPFVGIHGLHELDFVVGVISLTRGGIDLAATLRLAACWLRFAAGRSFIGLAAILTATIHGHD